MIYFLQAGKAGPIKVGFTIGSHRTIELHAQLRRNAKKKRPDLLPLRELGALALQDHDRERHLEREMHRRYWHLRVRDLELLSLLPCPTEWFAATAELLEFVAACVFVGTPPTHWSDSLSARAEWAFIEIGIEPSRHSLEVARVLVQQRIHELSAIRNVGRKTRKEILQVLGLIRAK